MRPLATVCVLLLVGCADPGPERYQQALTQYEALVARGALPSDPAFDEVLTQLERVPEDSKAHARAESLRQAILHARSRLPPRPLAGKAVHEDPEIAAVQRECAELAKRLGTVDAGQRRAAVGALQACRERLERLKAELHPHGEADGGH